MTRGGTLLILGHGVKFQGQLWPPGRGCHALLCLVFFVFGHISVLCLLAVIHRFNCTFIEILLLIVPGEGEAVGDLQSIVHHQPKEHPLHQIRASCSFLLTVLYDLQRHLQITIHIILHGKGKQLVVSSRLYITSPRSTPCTKSVPPAPSS